MKSLLDMLSPFHVGPCGLPDSALIQASIHSPSTWSEVRNFEWICTVKSVQKICHWWSQLSSYACRGYLESCLCVSPRAGPSKKHSQRNCGNTVRTSAAQNSNRQMTRRGVIRRGLHAQRRGDRMWNQMLWGSWHNSCLKTPILKKNQHIPSSKRLPATQWKDFFNKHLQSI